MSITANQLELVQTVTDQRSVGERVGGEAEVLDRRVGPVSPELEPFGGKERPLGLEAQPVALCNDVQPHGESRHGIDRGIDSCQQLGQRGCALGHFDHMGYAVLIDEVPLVIHAAGQGRGRDPFCGKGQRRCNQLTAD